MVTRLHRLPHFGPTDNPHAKVDNIPLPPAPAAHLHHRQPHLAGVNRLDNTCAVGQKCLLYGSGGQSLRVAQLVRVAALRGHKGYQLFKGRARGNRLGHPALGLGRCLHRRIAQQEHLGGDGHHQRLKVRRSLAVEGRYRLLHFQRIAHRVAQRLFHSGDEGGDFAPSPCPDGNHQPGQGAGVVQGFHKCAPATLHIQHNGIRARGQFFAHNAGGNEGQAGNSSRHIAQGVEVLVGGGQFGGLGGHHQPHFSQLAAEALLAQFRGPAWDALQFVNRAAAEAQPPPAHFAHRQPAGGHNRADGQSGFVAHAAAGMFVHNQRAVGHRVVQVEGVAAFCHRQGQLGGFGVGHPPKEDSHRPG